MTKHLGIEIGGTKLQLGVGTCHGELDELVRADVNVAAGAVGIVQQIEQIAKQLAAQFALSSVGIGFGGPVNVQTGQITKSHQIQGWDGFPLAERLRASLGMPVRIDNDCNVAALAEANLGAGQGASRVFYVTVGTGIGGGFVVDGELDGNQRPAISEIGHLRPGTGAVSAEDTVEAIASGWGISNWTRQQLVQQRQGTAALTELCQGDPTMLTTKSIGEAALRGNTLARAAIRRSASTLGWAIAQMTTLLAPEVVVVGGGVSLIGSEFFEPLRQAAASYGFPPLADTYKIVPAALGEQVVVHGALQIAVLSLNNADAP